MLLGTPLYMAPEAAHGGRAIEAPADVFAFGIIAYELLTKRTAFAMPPYILAIAKNGLPAPAPIEGDRFPRRVADCVQACFAEDPRKRPTAQDVLDALSASL